MTNELPVSDNGEYWGKRAQSALAHYAELMRPLVEKLQCGWCGHTYAEHPKTESHERCDGEVSDAERDETGPFCQCPGFASVREVREITTAFRVPTLEKPKLFHFSQGRVEELLGKISSRRLWRVECQNCEHAFQAHNSPGGCAGIHPDGGQCGCKIFATSHPEIIAVAKQVTKVKVILFKPSGKYYTEEEWRIPDGDRIGPYCMERSPDFRRIGGGAVLVESQEPWGFPHLFPGIAEAEE